MQQNYISFVHYFFKNPPPHHLLYIPGLKFNSYINICVFCLYSIVLKLYTYFKSLKNEGMLNHDQIWCQVCSVRECHGTLQLQNLHATCQLVSQLVLVISAIVLFLQVWLLRENITMKKIKTLRWKSHTVTNASQLKQLRIFK